MQLLVDDSCFMFNAQLAGQSQTIMFQPTPDAGRCIRQHIRLELTNGELIVDRQNAMFSPLAVDGPPEVDLPIGAVLQYCFNL